MVAEELNTVLGDLTCFFNESVLPVARDRA